MVIMAGGLARGSVRTTATTTELRKMAAILQLIRDLQIGLRVRDLVRVRVLNIKPVTFLESFLYMLVFR